MIRSGPRLRCLLAPNPSPLTGQGTNTYLIGSGEVAVVDPGPDMPDHLAAILAALSPGEQISRIVVTHAHRDHSALAAVLAGVTGAEILAYGTALDGRSALMTNLAPHLPSSGEGLDLGFRPDRLLANGDTIEGPDWQLTALHTPGHLGGHLCLATGDTLLSGDHVMGWSTTLVAPPDGDMGAYMASLHRLAEMSWRRFLPGHGAAVEDPVARIGELIAHRSAREAEILAGLAAGSTTIPALTRLIYHDTHPGLLPAAERNVLAHLIDLTARNLVLAVPFPHPEARFHRL